MTGRGSICWADLGEARGSKPAKRRPVLVIQSGPFNASRLNTTTIAAVITSNTALAAMPGNVFLPPASCRPPSWATSPEGCAGFSGSYSNTPAAACAGGGLL